MQNYVEKGTEIQNNIKETAVDHFSIMDILTYLILALAIFFLGLLNWAEFRFDVDRLDSSYIAHTATQVLSYSLIITSFTSKQIRKRKELSKDLAYYKSENKDILSKMRPDKLKEYIYNVNMEEKRTQYLNKYEGMLAKLEREYSKKSEDMYYDRSWKQYQEDLEEDPNTQPPDEYCEQKQLLLDKIDNVDQEYQNESIKYEKLFQDDLDQEIMNKPKKRIPRRRESTSSALGILTNMVLMFAFSLLVAGFFFGIEEDTIDAIVKTLVTVFMATFSAYKGMLNGDRVFNNVTLTKERFRHKHLYTYVVMEATKYKYYIGKYKVENHGE